MAYTRIEDRKAYARKWAKRNSDKIKVRARKWHLENVNGMLEKDYNTLYAKQQGKCAICGAPKRVLDVDHNHATGKIRGLLCRQCNHGLGLFKDSPDILLQASLYVTL